MLITNNHTTNFYNHLISLLEESRSFYFNVAFINFSGLQLLLDIFSKLENKGIKGKILTSTYLNFTEPKALEMIKPFSNIELKIYDSSELNRGFHPKAYIFEFEDYYKSIIGSSNITASALKSNVEWNIENSFKKDDKFINKLFDEFNHLWEESFYVDDRFLMEYSRYKISQDEIKTFNIERKPKANFMQQQALERLDHFKRINETKALAIAATGSGKTYLAALEILAAKPQKLLFLVHRENILNKAKESFELIIKGKNTGLFTGNKKELQSDYLFATIQTMSLNFGSFDAGEFDYIIVDEAHHISSPSYKKVIEYFRPKFLLGLTATPNRSDNENIYKYFDDNIACDIRLNDALENDLVSPFHYFGVCDVESIDYQNVNINDISEISKLLMVNRRVDYIIEKMYFYSYSGNKRKVLGFCASKEHALYMSDEFNKRGISSISLSSEDSIERRDKYIVMLEDENEALEVIFTVDIFNEGIDIPSVNTVLMLRPTNSPIVFIQQLGRGLRKHKNKEFLTILDFIGNHNKVYLITLALIGDKRIDKESLKISLLNNFANIANIHIFMDEISKKRILDQIESENFNSFKYLKEQYFLVKSQTSNKIPVLRDYLQYTEYINPIDFIDESKSYVEFISRVEKEEQLLKACGDMQFLKAIRFIDYLLPLNRPYEFVILSYLIINGEIDLEKARRLLLKYLDGVNEETLRHSFEYLDQRYFDKAQVSRYLKLADLEKNRLVLSTAFTELLKNDEYKNIIENSLEYGLLLYEREFGFDDHGMPFFKLYEKYNMLNVALCCNFNKIHSSFRGSGFLKYKDDFFLFITIEKEKFTKGVKYVNDFLSNDRFTFVSKPSHSQTKGDGEKLCQNRKYGVRLHIFARKSAHVDKKTQKFLYLGQADTLSYEGDKPISLELKLQIPLSDELYEEFTKVV